MIETGMYQGTLRILCTNMRGDRQMGLHGEIIAPCRKINENRHLEKFLMKTKNKREKIMKIATRSIYFSE
jgi:hypothetical protein